MVHAGLLLAAASFALGAAAEEGHGTPMTPTAFLGKALNSLILFGALAYLLAKTVRNLLDAKSAGIDRSIREAAESRSGADRRLEDARARLAGVGGELETIRKEGEAEAARAVSRIRETADREADRLKTLTRQEIELGVRGGLREIRGFAADLAIRSAEDHIRKRMTDEDHARLIDRSIERLGRLRDEEPSAR
ncbi:MAG: ATP synthase F0 subunit B [Candidatus Aminicenantes bacterium]|nr:ATP synthase F0 subunit B [Candidatus Aminicenantes bacterium]